MIDIYELPVEELIPHPDNPRKDLGDLTELAESIRANGIRQNLTVVAAERVDGVTIPEDDAPHYVVVIGHRRLAAAKLAGLSTVPCAVEIMDRKEQLSTMLLENMQRSDLTVYEQAMGFEQLRLVGCSVEEISDKSGFSQSTVRRRLKIAELDHGKLHTVAHDANRQLRLDDFERLEKVEDLTERNKVLMSIGTAEFDRTLNKAVMLQEVAKNKPAILEWLKAHGVKAIKSRSDTWSGKYEQLIIPKIGTFSNIYMDKFGEPGNTFPAEKNLDGIGDLFYFMDDRAITLYTKSKRTSTPKKSREELDREKLAREVKAEIWKIAEAHYELRKGFMARATFGKADRDKILVGIAYLSLYFATGWGSQHSEGAMKKLGISSYTSRTDELVKAVIGLVDGKDYKRLAATVYDCFNDRKEEVFASHMNVVGSVPYFDTDRDHNTKLTLLYRWLESLGYEPCEEEKQMIDGSHELYHRGDKK